MRTIPRYLDSVDSVGGRPDADLKTWMGCGKQALSIMNILGGEVASWALGRTGGDRENPVKFLCETLQHFLTLGQLEQIHEIGSVPANISERSGSGFRSFCSRLPFRVRFAF